MIAKLVSGYLYLRKFTLTFNRLLHLRRVTLVGHTGTAYRSGAPEFTPVFSGVRVTPSLVLCVVLCRSLFVILLSVLLRLTDSDFPFGIFKLFLATYFNTTNITHLLVNLNV